MLPHVTAKDGRLAFHQRTVLVGGGANAQLPALVGDQPGPAGAEPAGAGRVELLLEGLETAEGRGDGLRERALRLTAGVRPHDLPEHAVVGVAAAIVAH